MRASRIAALRRREGQEGAAAVEFAIVAVLLFMLVFGIIDFGFGLWDWNNSVNAAREGARKGAVDPSVSDIVARVQASASGLNPAQMTITVTCSHAGAAFGSCPAAASAWVEGDLVRVQVDYAYKLITPFAAFVPGVGTTWTLHSQSEARFEG